MKKIGSQLENIELNKAEQKEGKTVLESLPINYAIILGKKCDLDCIMCGQHKIHRRIFNRNWEQIISTEVIDEILELSKFAKDVLISGGEPLIYPQASKIYQGISKNKHGTMSIMTNGNSLDTKWIKRICSKHFGQLIISLDAATERTYSRIRRKGDFSKVLDATRQIRKRSKSNSHPQISWWFVVMKHNYREIIPFIELAEKHKVNSVAVSCINYQRPRFYLENPLYDKARAQELLVIAEKAEKMATDAGIGLLDRIRPTVFSKYPDLGPKELKLTDKESISKYGKIPCDFFWTTLKVESGSVWACPWVKKRYRNIPFDHREQNIRSIWNTELFKEARKKMHAGEYSDVCGPYCPIYLQWKMGQM